MTIPTTLEMDGLLSEQDINDRHLVYRQCRECSKWTFMDLDKAEPECSNCGEHEYDLNSTKSKRTFNPGVDNKRKIK